MHLVERKAQDSEIGRMTVKKEESLPAPVVPSFRVEFSKPGD
jgi:hypothetical protein